MGIFIDYTFNVECPEPELIQRMGRLREKLSRLPFDSVSEVIPVDPVYNPLYIRILTDSGTMLPDCVSARIKIASRNKLHPEWCMMLAPPVFMVEQRKLVQRFYKPGRDFCKTTKLWHAQDLPEKIDDGFDLTLFRGAFELEFASVMLRRGYLIVVQPCEGCETFTIGLSSFHVPGVPFWLGSGFTKTTYATRFVEAHESICTALDFAAEEGLLHSADDSCGYYKHRDWSQSADIVNTETTATKAIADALRAGIKKAKKTGMAIEDISSPATRNYNVIKVDKKK